jgi:transposase
MRQMHPAGERMFVDYAGQTVELVDGRTGEISRAQVSVAVIGASSYLYAEASWTQTLPDWIGSHVRALAFMSGVSAQLVPDNPKVGVDRANWSSQGSIIPISSWRPIMAAILPTRPRKPRGKAKWRLACWWWNAGFWRGQESIANSLVGTCMPGSKWPWPTAAFSA